MPKATGVSFGGASKYDIERRKKMAAALMEQGKQPEKTEIVSGWAVPQSPLAGLAKALQTGLGGYQEAKAAEMEQQRQDNARQTMADAMSAYSRSQDTTPTQLQNGETINWNQPSLDKSGQMYANMLMQNEDTAPMGMQAMQNNMELAQRTARENELMKQRQAFEMQMFNKKAALDQQLTPYQSAMLELQRKEAANAGQLTPYQEKQIELENKKLDFQKQRYGLGDTVDPNTGEITPQFPPVKQLSAGQKNTQAKLNQTLASVAAAKKGFEDLKAVYERTGEKAPYTGWGAEAMASAAAIPVIGNFIDQNRAASTKLASNISGNNVVENLKASFGGMPTEGERKYLEELQAFPSMTKQQQDALIQQGLSMLDEREKNTANENFALTRGMSLAELPAGFDAREFYSNQQMTQNMLNTPNSPQNIGAQGQGSNPALTQPYDQIKPVLQGGGEPPIFSSEQEAENAGLPVGTVIFINGRRAVVE